MPKYRFSRAQRVALWEAHNRRCAYSDEPLAFADLHVDHIVPEDLLNHPEELAQLKNEYGLALSFEINSYYNWLPVHQRLNRRKAANVFGRSAVTYYLELARSRQARAVEIEAVLGKQATREKAILALTFAVAKGAMTLDDALVEIEALRGERGEFKLSVPLDFTEQSIVGAVGHDDVDFLRSLTVTIGDQHAEGLVLVGPEDSEITVRTCREYRAAIHKGFYAQTTYAMKMASFFNRTCGVVDALSIAQYPVQSYISNVGITDIALLPVTLSPGQISPDVRELVRAGEERGETIKDWINSGALKVSNVGKQSLRLEGMGGGVVLWELLRADLMGEGFEDLLAYRYDYAIGGTFGYGDVFSLTRPDREGPFAEFRGQRR